MAKNKLYRDGNQSYVSLRGVLRRSNRYTSAQGTDHLYFTIGFTHEKYCFAELPFECHAVGNIVQMLENLPEGSEIEVVGEFNSVKNTWKNGTEHPKQQVFVNKVSILSAPQSYQQQEPEQEGSAHSTATNNSDDVPF